jgi:pSer/pThr/pTyr-binding forkhead associated (FHA) protein
VTRHIAKLESRLETLIEGTFARWFASRLHPQDVAVQLIRALEDSALRGVPALRYLVHLHPADAQALLGEQPHLAETLTEELVSIARATSLTLIAPPEVILLPDSTLKPRRIVVTTETNTLIDPSLTQGATPTTPGAPLAPFKAFLILEGYRTLPLTQAVVSLGRRADNHIILDDPRVSRAHAQLRLRFGRYVLYDLGASGGTFVNNQRVQECVLKPGDVISLAGVPLIYGEEEAEEIPTPKSPNPKAQTSNSEWT